MLTKKVDLHNFPLIFTWKNCQSTILLKHSVYRKNAFAEVSLANKSPKLLNSRQNVNNNNKWLLLMHTIPTETTFEQ